MQNALLACIFSSIICGIIGIVITEKKLVMMRPDEDSEQLIISLPVEIQIVF